MSFVTAFCSVRYGCCFLAEFRRDKFVIAPVTSLKVVVIDCSALRMQDGDAVDRESYALAHICTLNNSFSITFLVDCPFEMHL